MTKKWLETEVRRLGEIQPWWHDIELPQGVRTINRSGAVLEVNHNAVKWSKLKPLIDFQGKSVIDLGCNEGFYCHEAMRGGARRVIGVDINPHRIEKATFASSVLGFDAIQFKCMTAYDVTQETLEGRFDLALLLGMLHRVPDPFSLIIKAAELADNVVFEWSALDTEQPLMMYWGGGWKEYDRDNSGYWRMSRRCVLEILLRTNMRFVSHIDPENPRAILAAKVDSHDKTLSCPWQALPDAINATQERTSVNTRRKPWRWLRRAS